MDVANWFLDEHPISAQGMGGREVRKGIDHGEIFDHHYVEFKYPSGAVIHSQCRHQPGTLRKVNEVLVGTKGVINLRNGGVVTINDHNGNLLHKYDPKNDISPYQIEHNKLFKSIRSGGQIDDTEIGATATMTAIMGRMATYTGKKITWDQIMNSKENLVPDNLTWNLDITGDSNNINTLQNDASDSVLNFTLTGDSADVDINQLTGTCASNNVACSSPISSIDLNVTSDNAVIQINQKDSANDS